MTSLNLPDPDVLLKWWQKICELAPRTWSLVTRREARACRKLSTRFDLLVGNIWPYLSGGSGRTDSLRSVLESLLLDSKGEDQKTKSQILSRYRILGAWLSFLHIRVGHTLIKRSTRLALTDCLVEMNAILGGIEQVVDEFGMSSSTLAACSQGIRQHYIKFRDTYNHFLTEYEAFCRDARAAFREVQEPSLKRLE